MPKSQNIALTNLIPFTSIVMISATFDASSLPHVASNTQITWRLTSILGIVLNILFLILQLM